MSVREQGVKSLLGKVLPAGPRKMVSRDKKKKRRAGYLHVAANGPTSGDEAAIGSGGAGGGGAGGGT